MEPKRRQHGLAIFEAHLLDVEILPGYRFGDRLLRAAMVVVARPSTGATKSGDGANGVTEINTDDA